MYRKILLATDGSELAWSAVREVAQLAGPGTEVLVVQVIDTVGRIVAQTTPAGFYIEGTGRFAVDAAQDVVSSQQRAAQEHLGEVEAELKAAGLDSVTSRVLEGLPGPAIVELADEAGCDVIVMATHGRSGVLRAVLGSVADHVVRHARRSPVLLVRREEDEPEASPES